MRTADRTLRYEAQVAVFAKLAMEGRPPGDAPCIVDVMAVFPIAASWPKKRRAAALAGEVYPTSRPDADNLLKSLADGANGIVWTDDSRIVDARIRKRYGEVPGLHVSVTWAAPTQPTA